MTLQDLAKQFVDLCNQGKNFDVMKTLYADDIVSVESTGQETKGKGPVIEKSAKWASNIDIHGEKVVGPYFHAADQFAVHFTFEFTPKSTGVRVSQQEIGVYTVKNGLIVKEVFYNAGNW